MITFSLYKDGLGYSVESILSNAYPEEVNIIVDRTSKESAWRIFLGYLNHSTIIIRAKKHEAESQAFESAVKTLASAMSAMNGINCHWQDGGWEREARRELSEMGDRLSNQQ